MRHVFRCPLGRAALGLQRLLFVSLFEIDTAVITLSHLAGRTIVRYVVLVLTGIVARVLIDPKPIWQGARVHDDKAFWEILQYSSARGFPSFSIHFQQLLDGPINAIELCCGSVVGRFLVRAGHRRLSSVKRGVTVGRVTIIIINKSMFACICYLLDVSSVSLSSLRSTVRARPFKFTLS